MAWSAPTEWERWNPEQLLECPYDPVHRIPAKRYQYHIIKCRKQHPEKDYVSCPFNAKHIMLRPELRQHITKCPEKSEVEPYSYKGTERDSDGFYFKGDTSVPSYRKEELSIQPVDEWDREDDTVNHYSTQPLDVIPPSSSNQFVQDVLSLKPEDRDKFKNTLRSRAIQNDFKPPHYQTVSMSNNAPGLNCDYAPKTNLKNRQRNVCQQESNGYTIHTDRLLSCNANNEHSLCQHGLSSSTSNTSHQVTERPQTFRGKGRARLAEEARRTQFGVTNSNTYSGIQTHDFTVGRGRGVLGFSHDIKR